jgi:hypothetical protein
LWGLTCFSQRSPVSWTQVWDGSVCEATENESDSFLRCPDERQCEQRTDQHDHGHEDRSWWIESNAQFTVRKTMGNVDQQAGNNNGGHVLS